MKAELNVKFKVGSSQISPEDQKQLAQLAKKAIEQTGYIIEMRGYADSSGNALMNEELSKDRAEAVVGYLIQQCNVPVRHIMAPGAMGEYQPAASNETAEGRAERVGFRVLVNKGIAGGWTIRLRGRDASCNITPGSRGWSASTESELHTRRISSKTQK